LNNSTLLITDFEIEVCVSITGPGLSPSASQALKNQYDCSISSSNHVDSSTRSKSQVKLAQEMLDSDSLNCANPTPWVCLILGFSEISTNSIVTRESDRFVLLDNLIVA